MLVGIILAGVVTAADPVTDSTSVFLVYGPLGAFTSLAVLAGIALYRRDNTRWTEREIQFANLLAAEKARADEAERRAEALGAKLIDSMVPAMTRFSDNAVEVLAELRSAIRERR